MAGADNLVRERPQSSLLARLDARATEEKTRKPEPEPPPPPEIPGMDDPDALPRPGSVYQARSRLSNKPELMLTFLLKDGSRKGFSYGDLRYVEFMPAGGTEGIHLLVLRFVGVGDVRLEGRNLDTLHDDVRRQLVAWVRERPPGRDYVEDRNALVVTGIDVTVLE